MAFFDPRDRSYLTYGQLSGWAAACDITQVGDRLVATDNVAGAVSIYSLPEVERIEQISIAGTPIDLRISPNSAFVHLITHNGRYYRISLSSLIADTNMTGQDPRRLRLRPPNAHQTWITCKSDSSIRVVREQGLTEIRRIALPAVCSDLEFSPGGFEVYCALPGKSQIWVIESDNDAVLDTLPLQGNSVELAISSDGRYLMATDSTRAAAEVFDLVNETVSTVYCGSGSIRVRYSVTSEAFFAICPGQSYVLRIDPATTPPSVTDTLHVEAIPQCMALLE